MTSFENRLKGDKGRKEVNSVVYVIDDVVLNGGDSSGREEK